MKIVINSCYGDFDLDSKYKKLIFNDAYIQSSDIDRSNTKLIQLVEKSDFKNVQGAKLKIITIPDNITDLKIVNNDGKEKVFVVIDGKIKTID